MERPQEELWDQADAVLDRLLDLPESRRIDALREMRLAADLEACVRRLLHAHGHAGVLDRSADGVHPLPHRTLAGRRIGPWTLERELGRGGMSVVWSGSRGEGATRQRAAIKLLPVGAMVGTGSARFRREQAILARLNHPHIAHLYEAGEADDGTPYLAMEQVDGERIDVWCEQRGLAPAVRVRLVLDVCEAIAYAHRNLVVHADLKPSNVLVDDDGHVRVLDFGIGRLLDEGHAEATRTLWRALTPEYAAPEQLDGEPAATSTDVFGLGALLYRLLADQPPRGHHLDRQLTAPSRVLLRGVGDKRAAQQMSRVRLLRGDLDTIVLKALKTEPDQRYHSVDAFAADLEAWLQQRPIAARPPSRRYRIGKFVRRNRLAVAATAAVVIAVAAGVTATVWQARRANAQAAAAQLQAQRAVAVKDVLVTLLQRTDPGRVAGDPPASELLRMGSRSMRSDRSLAPAIRVELLRVIGVSQRARGQFRDARRTLDAALALYADGSVRDAVGEADTLSKRGWVAYELSDIEGAIRMFRRADALLDAGHGPFTPLHEHIRAGLVDLLIGADRPAQATAMATDLVARMRRQGRTHTHDYGYTLRLLGAAADIDHRPLQAIDWLQQSARAFDPVEDAPSLATVHNELGLADWHAGRLHAAAGEFRTALRGYAAVYGADHPRALMVRLHLASVHVEQGRPALAVTELGRVRERARTSYGDAPSRLVALADYWLARAYYRSGATDRALVPARAAWQMGQRLEPEFRAQHDTLAPFLGLLRFELHGADAADLLDTGLADCGTDVVRMALPRWICIARRLRQADRGQCADPLPLIQPPALPDDGVERRWWAAWHLWRARCLGAERRAGELHAARMLAVGARPRFPAWLLARLASAPVRR